MGSIFVTMEAGDMRGGRFEPVEVMVDTGPTFTTVPAGLLRGLGVSPQRTMPARLADGTMVNDEVCDTVIRLEGQTFFTPVTFGRKGNPICWA